MRVEEQDVAGVLLVTPTQHADDRGVFLESMRADVLAEHVGHTFALAQANTSVSRRGVLRGVHFAQVPPGQAKYVTCARGAVLDVAVDLRVGSPTWLAQAAAVLDDVDRRALYLPEGVGHAFLALTDDATVSYFCSTPYTPEREHTVSPLDPALGLTWPEDVPLVLSPRDAEAPTLADSRAAGVLPTWDEYETYVTRLRTRPGRGQ